MPLGEDIPLDTTVSLISTGVNLTELEASFRVEA
jgi:hypothetical protein